ncbi:MAG: hypothetical protein A2Z88_00715 [Omnitrophica WOR_2 bacterium GWA2_47_8]|nr:MAG: hypothetical protein A2Z88_00715 [Omnitrophica WOR_2 bacterium GWA2_47_8]
MRKNCKEPLIVAFLILTLIAISFYDVVLLGHTFKMTLSRPQALPTGAYGQEKNIPPFIPAHNMESSYIDEPLHEFIAKYFRQGILPLWDPHQAAGFPIIGMMQLGIFYPLNFFLFFLPQAVGWDFLILSRFIVGALLGYWFMRVMGFQKPSALATAIAFMLSGPMVLFQYATANDDILLFLIFIALEYLLRNPSPRQIALSGACIALVFFAGHGEHYFLNNIYGFLFFCFRLWTREERKTVQYVRKSFLNLFAVYALGFGLASVLLFPFLRNFFTEFWNHHSPDIGLEKAWVPTSWALAMFNPLIFKKALTPETFIYSEYWGGYIGIVPIGLAFLSLFSRQKQKLNYFFAFILFLVVSKYFGLPYIQWIGKVFPFNYCNLHTHSYHITAVTVSILAGMGLETAMTNAKSFKIGSMYSLALGLVFVLYLIFFPKEGELTFAMKGFITGMTILFIFTLILGLKEKNVLKQSVAAVLLLTLLFGELFLYIHRGRPKRFDSFSKAPYIEFIKQSPERARSFGVLFAFFSNTASGYQVDDLGIVLLLLPKRFVKFVNYFLLEDYFKKARQAKSSLEVVPITFFPEQKPYLDMLNVKYTVAPQNLPPILTVRLKQPDAPRLIFQDKVNMYERPGAFSRAFIVHRVLFEPDETRSIDKIKEISKAFDKVALLQAETQSGIINELVGTPVKDNSKAQITRYSPNEVIVTAQMENAGFLVLGDAYHPDWKAYVNGKPVHIFITNFLVRSVFLPKGEHEVRFVFAPMSFYYGLIVSMISLGMALILILKRRS